jgi:hypothetical protein
MRRNIFALQMIAPNFIPTTFFYFNELVGLRKLHKKIHIRYVFCKGLK